MPYRLSTIIKALCATGSCLCLAEQTAWSGEADVEKVAVSRDDDGTFRFDVTVKHADGGWDHYANRWQVVAPNGRVLATRVLAHPHVNEQPFTRSLSGINIPEGTFEVIVRAGDNVHGIGGAAIVVVLPGA